MELCADQVQCPVHLGPWAMHSLIPRPAGPLSFFHMFLYLIVVPTPTVSITSNPTGIITVGSSVTLTCTVVLDSSVDVPVTVSTVWTGPDYFNRNIMAQQMGSTTTYTSTVMVSSFGREQSGDYTCTATVSSASPFITSSMSSSSTTRVTVGMYI